MPHFHRLFIVGLFLLSPAPLLAQPEYKGPQADSGKKAKAYPDVSDIVTAAEHDLQAPVAALQRQEKSAAKKPLESLRKDLEKALTTNPTSRPAAELLGAVYFYLGEAGDKSSYQRCVKFLEKVYEKDPDALAATGYLRHWIYEYNQRDARTQWGDMINEVTFQTSAGFNAIASSPSVGSRSE